MDVGIDIEIDIHGRGTFVRHLVFSHVVVWCVMYVQYPLVCAALLQRIIQDVPVFLPPNEGEGTTLFLYSAFL